MSRSGMEFLKKEKIFEKAIEKINTSQNNF